MALGCLVAPVPPCIHIYISIYIYLMHNNSLFSVVHVSTSYSFICIFMVHRSSPLVYQPIKPAVVGHTLDTYDIQSTIKVCIEDGHV